MSMTRRDVLTSTAAAGLAALAGFRGEEEKVRLGVASYSLRKFKRPQAIEMVKACGTRYVNIKSFHLPYNLSPEEIKAARKEFDDAGLKVVGSGNNGIKKEADIEKVFTYAKHAGFPLLVIAPNPDLLPKIEAAVKKSGIVVAIHNHGPEDKVFPSMKDAMKRIKDLDPGVGVCADIGHAARTGADVVQELADCGPRLLDMHVKDLRDLRDKKSQCVVGEGKMPMKEIFGQLVRMKYAGYANLEYEIDASDPLEGMKKSFANMRKVLASL